MSAALILLPTHDHPLMLPLALRSACDQSIENLRIVVVGDGVGDDTRDCLAPFLHADQRIEFLDLPKAGRTGEPHRDQVVRCTDAPFVTYLGDDDLFAPDHVATMHELLENADLAHPPRVLISVDGAVCCDAIDLGDPAWREIELTGMSLVGLTGLAHTIDAYRRLPYGWRETPAGGYTDQYMIRQFLSQPWCRAIAGEHATMLHFPGSLRTAMTSGQRLEELDTWAQRLTAPGGWARLRTEADRAFRRDAQVHRRSAIDYGDRLHHANLRIIDLERAVQRLETAQDVNAGVLAAANEERDSAHRDRDAARAALIGSRAAFDELVGELDRAGDAERAALDTCAELSTTVASLQDVLAAKSREIDVLTSKADELDALLTTRTMRFRSILIRSRLVRAVFARRHGGR